MENTHKVETGRDCTNSQAEPGSLLTSTRNTSMDPDTPLANFTDIAVYTRSGLVEQSVPATFSISDTYALARALGFEDDDLDGLEIAGDLSWQPPPNLDQVTHYVTYLSNSSDGTWRSQVGTSDIPVGTNQQILLQDGC
ncbi:PIF1 [Symbiodinium natans]|uniref:PIF1 protein n=1 Tax=Symbiodinium natans TaxID=878477 RepID=A0A812QEB4_9DINO|nr:PIF1 [Symbiodinium natans]